MAGGAKYIESADKMMEYFNEYIAYAKSTPYIVKDWVGGVAKEVLREKERPLTFVGFEVFMYHKGVIKTLEDYEINKGGRYGEFVEVIKLIKKIIEEDMLAGAAAGIYKENIVSRKLGIRDNIDDNGDKNVTIKVKYDRKGSNPKPTA